MLRNNRLDDSATIFEYAYLLYFGLTFITFLFFLLKPERSYDHVLFYCTFATVSLLLVAQKPVFGLTGDLAAYQVEFRANYWDIRFSLNQIYLQSTCQEFFSQSMEREGLCLKHKPISAISFSDIYHGLSKSNLRLRFILESGFYFPASLIYALTNSYAAIFIVFDIVCLLVILCASRFLAQSATVDFKAPRLYWLPFLVLASWPFVIGFDNMYRQLMSNCIIVLAASLLLTNRNKAGWLVGLSSLLFHNSSLLFFPVLALMQNTTHARRNSLALFIASWTVAFAMQKLLKVNVRNDFTIGENISLLFCIIFLTGGLIAAVFEKTKLPSVFGMKIKEQYPFNYLPLVVLGLIIVMGDIMFDSLIVERLAISASFVGIFMYAMWIHKFNFKHEKLTTIGFAVIVNVSFLHYGQDRFFFLAN